MNIGLDFDDTVTLAPDLWEKFVELFKGAGHSVFIVTLRPDSSLNSDIEEFVRASGADGAFFTAGVQKSLYCESQGIHIDVYIDDSPAFIPAPFILKNVYDGCVKNKEDLGSKKV